MSYISVVRGLCLNEVEDVSRGNVPFHGCAGNGLSSLRQTSEGIEAS